MLEIRILNAEDALKYRELRLKSLKENPEAFLTTHESESAKPIERTEQQLVQAEGRFTLGAFDGNDLVGIVTFVREDRPKISHKGNVYAMYVVPEYRGSGVGKALITRLVDMAGRLGGLEQIRLTVVSSNAAAKRLYEKAGFHAYAVEQEALKDGNHYWDEELMVLRLQKTTQTREG